MKKKESPAAQARTINRTGRGRALPGALLAVLCFFALPLAARSRRAYSGPPVPGDQVAMVYVSDIKILSVNGVARYFADSTVEFLPGRYELLVRLHDGSSISRPVPIAFTAVAGRDYALEGDYETRGGFFDKNTYFTPVFVDITSEAYEPGPAKIKEKRYRKLRRLVAGSREKRLEEYRKFLDRLASFEPVRLRFFEYDGTTVPDGIQPATSFELASSRYILAQLKVKNLKPDLAEHRHTLRWQYYFPQQWTADGKMKGYFHVGDITSEVQFKQGQEHSFPWVSWGSQQKGWIWGQGNPVMGTYAVAVYLDDVKVFEDRFVIH